MGATGARSQKENMTSGYLEPDPRPIEEVTFPARAWLTKDVISEWLYTFPVEDSQGNRQDGYIHLRAWWAEKRLKADKDLVGSNLAPSGGQQAGEEQWVSLTSHNEGAWTHGWLARAVSTRGQFPRPGSVLGLPPGTADVLTLA